MDVVAPPPPAADGWQLDLFQILFVSMGQGDCCVITCPDGKHVMIDCGSKAEESDSSWHNIAGEEILRSKYVFEMPGADRHLEALILTHPDIDHISKVSELLGAEAASYTYSLDTTPVGTLKRSRDESESFRLIRAKAVYFSHPSCTQANFFTPPPGQPQRQRALDEFLDGPLAIFRTNDCNDTIYRVLKVEKLCCVTLNPHMARLDTWSKPTVAITGARKPFSRPDHAEQLNIDRSSVVVCSGTAKGVQWSIKIIAGNVPKDPGEFDPSDQDGRNAGSLVTLITFGTNKILICGDMTFSTENYLLSDTCPFKNDLQNLSLIQLPHHGSSVTSFSQRFADWVKAKRAVASVQLHEHSHHLPGDAVITRALTHAQAYDDHPVHYWRLVSSDDFNKLKLAWEGGAVVYTIERDSQNRPARYVYTDPPDNYAGVIVLDGLNSPSSALKYALYQAVAKKEVRLTAIEGHIWYYFDGKGI